MNSADRNRIARIVAGANGVQLASLSPTDPAQARREQIRRLTADAVRLSDRRAVLLILVEQ